MKRKSAPKKGLARKLASPPATLDPDILPTLLGYNVRRAQIVLWRDFARTVAEGEIRPGMFSALALVKANPGVAQVELSTELGIDKASMVGLIDRLEEAGWVLRTRSQEDRRRQGLTLTSSGEKMYRALKREMVDHEQKFAALYSETERKQLINLLRRLHHVEF